MSSECPPQLHLSIQPSTTSFKRSFEQFDFDVESPGGRSDAGSSSASNGNDRNKRARSSSSFSESVASGSSSHSSSFASGSTGMASSRRDVGVGLLSTRAPPPPLPVNPTASTYISHQPPRIPTPTIQDIDMSDYRSDVDNAQLFSLNLGSQTSQLSSRYRPSLQRIESPSRALSTLRPIQSSLTTGPRSSTPPPSLPPLSISVEEPHLSTANIPFLQSSHQPPASFTTRTDAPITPLHTAASRDNAIQSSEQNRDPGSSWRSVTPQNAGALRLAREPLSIALVPEPRSHSRSRSRTGRSPPRRPVFDEEVDEGFVLETFRQRLNSAFEPIRSPSPLVPELEDAEEVEENEHEDEEWTYSATSATLSPAEPPILPPILTSADRDWDTAEELFDHSSSAQPARHPTDRSVVDDRSPISPMVGTVTILPGSPNLPDVPLPSPFNVDAFLADAARPSSTSFATAATRPETQSNRSPSPPSLNLMLPELDLQNLLAPVDDRGEHSGVSQRSSSGSSMPRRPSFTRSSSSTGANAQRHLPSPPYGLDPSFRQYDSSFDRYVRGTQRNLHSRPVTFPYVESYQNSPSSPTRGFAAQPRNASSSNDGAPPFMVREDRQIRPSPGRPSSPIATMTITTTTTTTTTSISTPDHVPPLFDWRRQPLSGPRRIGSSNSLMSENDSEVRRRSDIAMMHMMQSRPPSPPHRRNISNPTPSSIPVERRREEEINPEGGTHRAPLPFTMRPPPFRPIVDDEPPISIPGVRIDPLAARSPMLRALIRGDPDAGRPGIDVRNFSAFERWLMLEDNHDEESMDAMLETYGLRPRRTPSPDDWDQDLNNYLQQLSSAEQASSVRRDATSNAPTLPVPDLGASFDSTRQPQIQVHTTPRHPEPVGMRSPVRESPSSPPPTSLYHPRFAASTSALPSENSFTRPRSLRTVRDALDSQLASQPFSGTWFDETPRTSRRHPSTTTATREEDSSNLSTGAPSRTTGRYGSIRARMNAHTHPLERAEPLRTGLSGTPVSAPHDPLDPAHFRPGPFRNTLMFNDSRQRRANNLPSAPPTIPPLPFESLNSDNDPPPGPGAPPGAFAEWMLDRDDRRLARRNLLQTLSSGPSATATATGGIGTSRTTPQGHERMSTDLHSYLNRHVRLQLPRVDARGSSPVRQIPGENPAFTSAIEAIRHDGPTTLRSEQLPERFPRHSHAYPSRTMSLNAGADGTTNTTTASRNASRRVRYEAHRGRDQSPPRIRLEGLDDLSSSDSGDSFEVPRGRRARFGRNTDSFLSSGRFGTGGRTNRNLGDYMRDEDFDESYESLLSLSAMLGEAKPKATPSEIISTLESAQYRDWATKDSDQRCPICLEDYQPLDVVLKSNNCTHWLHKDCLHSWLKGANTCPVCRKSLNTEGASGSSSSSSNPPAAPPRIPISSFASPFGVDTSSAYLSDLPPQLVFIPTYPSYYSQPYQSPPVLYQSFPRPPPGNHQPPGSRPNPNPPHSPQGGNNNDPPAREGFPYWRA